MNMYYYNGEDDYIGMLRYLVQTKMEKSPGTVIIAGERFEISCGKFVDKVPPVVNEVRNILADLIRKH